MMKAIQKLFFSALLALSTAFGADNKWAFFPSASFAWRASEEEFIKQLNLFSDLKVRVGFGSSGNNNIPSYQSLGLWTSVNTPMIEGKVPSFVIDKLPNTKLTWESNNTFNVGVDAGFFNQRLVITPEVYVSRANNLI